MINPGTLRLLFHELREAGYEWEPQTPDRLLHFRKEPDTFRPLLKCFGLGLPVHEDELTGDGLTPAILRLLIDQGFLKDLSIEGASAERFCKASMALSGRGELYIVHDHWPPANEGGYVHYGAESSWLARAVGRDLEGFIGKRVLDLGCGSGILSFEVAAVADEVLGLDISARAIDWGRVLCQTLGFKNIRFERGAIGQPSAEEHVGTEPWDVVVMNPPMIVPDPDADFTYRDGGKLGIELPLKFLEFAANHLVPGGELTCLVTNPIVKGRPMFFESFDKKAWEVLEKRCVQSHFNRAVARKQNYADQGIERIELWQLFMKRA